LENYIIELALLESAITSAVTVKDIKNAMNGDLFSYKNKYENVKKVIEETITS
jgi:hypothetical protein